jgi:protocatechuate 3,4-dioxygenase beta subunit
MLVTVRVLREGRPVPDAEVYRLISKSLYHDGIEAVSIKIGRTGRNGAISLPVRARSGRIYDGSGIVARIPGSLAGFTRISRYTDPDSVVIPLFPVRPISGVVRDSQGKPVSGAEISVWHITGDGISKNAFIEPYGTLPGTSAKSDAQGRFRLEGIPEPSIIIFNTTAPGYSLLQSRDIPAGTDNLSVILEPGSRITGRALYETGEPVKGVFMTARARLFSPLSSGVGHCRTDENGNFSFENLSAGMYTVYANPDSTFQDWAPLPLENIGVGRGKSAEGLEVRFIRGITVTGTVLEEETGNPLPGVRVSANCFIHNPSDRYNPAIYVPMGYAWTDAQGKYRIRVVPGDIQVSASPPEEFYRGVRSQKVTIEKGENEVRGVNLSVIRGAEIRGTVRKPDGTPAGGAEISTGPGSGAIYSDRRGQFTMSGIPSGNQITLHVSLPKEDLDAFATVKAVPGAKVDIVLMKPEYASVSGVVQDADGAPAPGIMVTVGVVEGSSVGSSPQTTVTDKSGKFSFHRILAGRHYQCMVRDGLASSPVFLAGKDSGPFPITLPRADRWLEGTVKDAEKKPVAGMKVDAWGKAGHAETTTGGDGSFRLDGLAGERLDVSMRGMQGMFRFQNVPTNQTRDFILPTGRHYLSGMTADSSGKPLPGALVRIDRAEEGGRYTAIETDAGGCFHLSNLGLAEVQITVSCPGYREKKLTVKTDREDVVIALEEAKGKK